MTVEETSAQTVEGQTTTASAKVKTSQWRVFVYVGPGANGNSAKEIVAILSDAEPFEVVALDHVSYQLPMTYNKLYVSGCQCKPNEWFHFLSNSDANINVNANANINVNVNADVTIGSRKPSPRPL